MIKYITLLLAATVHTNALAAVSQVDKDIAQAALTIASYAQSSCTNIATTTERNSCVANLLIVGSVRTANKLPELRPSSMSEIEFATILQKRASQILGN